MPQETIVGAMFYVTLKIDLEVSEEAFRHDQLSGTVSYADIINIMVEYGAVNACNLDGGSSTVMLYRDHNSGEVSMINSYSLLQEQPRRMPTFIMVRPESEG